VVTLTDAAFGRVLDKLESTGLSANTIITFIGDHGYQVRAAPFISRLGMVHYPRSLSSVGGPATRV
jgi:arylsulfatase A-like enzyme